MKIHMRNQLLLFAKIQLYRANFQMLHWKVCGKGFDRFHANITTECYEKLDKDADDIAEILMRQGASPLNYYEVLTTLNNDGGHTKIIKSNKDYSAEDVTKCISMYYEDICSQILKCLDSDAIKNVRENVGIKSYYEALYNEYDKELRFLNRRRSCDQCCSNEEEM